MREDHKEREMNVTADSVDSSAAAAAVAAQDRDRDEDLHLAELVAEALEKNGALAGIRARLRADIFLLLGDEREAKHRNPRLRSVLSTQDGILTLLLVQELFDFCGLDRSRSVFDAETGGNRTYIYENRSNVSQYFSFADVRFDDGAPLLVGLIGKLLELLHSEKIRSGESPNGSETSRKAERNDTFLVHADRSDNYDLSFTSESSGVVEDDGPVPELNLRDSSDDSARASSDPERPSVVALAPPAESPSASVSPRSEVIEEIIRSDNERSRRNFLDRTPDETKSDDSILEDIVGSSECNGSPAEDHRRDSPPPNILDASIPETPNTKMRINERIEFLKGRSDSKPANDNGHEKTGIVANGVHR